MAQVQARDTVAQATYFIRGRGVTESRFPSFSVYACRVDSLGFPDYSECFPEAGNDPSQVRNLVIPVGACTLHARLLGRSRRGTNWPRSPSKESVLTLNLLTHCFAAVGDMMDVTSLRVEGWAGWNMQDP